MRTASSTLITSVEMSLTATERTRSRSCTTARRTRSRRGCALRARRSSACLSVDSSGSVLPVIAACCTATRSAASMSDSMFSSRERVIDCSRSSSCVRCSVFSATRDSSSATLATASRDASWAWRASTRASVESVVLSC